MECPKCHTDNHETRKFCRECGAKLLLICPQCGSENLPGDKFCGECGHNLSISTEPAHKDLSFDEKIDKIQRYLPKGLTEKILSQRDKIEGERKQVTVMFCDMEGFTPLVERLGAEEAYDVMDKVYELLIHKVHDYDGTVNEMTGDGIMALFGAPIALEDAPQRALRSALSIHREMTRFNDKFREGRRGIPTIKMRIGIHSGPVVVGTLGNNLRVEFKAVGDTVNLASRMEGLAEPGTTYVTEDTFKLTEGLFRFEALGERQVKGKDTPIRIYQVIAPSSHRTRFDVSAEMGLTKFVGRDRELELLLDGLARAKRGAGQAFSIIGEAGIGKSRFLYEFRKGVSNEDISFLEGKCLSYGRGIPYHPISDVLKGNFEIEEDDNDEAIQKKVKMGLKALKVDEAATLPYLLELLSVRDSGIDDIALSPEGRRDRMIEAVRRIILNGSQMRPLVIAIEDLHWADRSTEEALKWLLESVPGARVLIIFTYRPEFLHTWGGRSYHNQITLNRLSNRESLLLVSSLLGTETIDPGLQDLILSKTEGVPFFIEELAKSLLGMGVIKKEGEHSLLQGDPQSISIPSTIQDMIMARVDRLSDDTKAVLQAGSAIEREFPHSLIRAVTGLSEEELLTHISTLKEDELLYERGIYPQTSYIFRHALTREVVYESILGRKRKEIHAKIARALEELHKEDLTGNYEILSEHFSKGEDYAKAAEYATHAARKAIKNASVTDAIEHAQKRIKFLEMLPSSLGVGKEVISARSRLGMYLLQINHFVEAMNAVEPVITSVRGSIYGKLPGQIQTVMGCFYGFVEEDFPKSFVALDEAVRVAREEKHILTLSLASMWLGIFKAFECDFEKGMESIQQSVDIAVAAKNLWGIASMKAQMAYFCHYWSGRIDLHTNLSLEAFKTAEGSGDPISKGMSHITYGMAFYGSGDLKSAAHHILEGHRLCERIGMYGWAALGALSLAETYFSIGEYQKSQECYHKASRIWEDAKSQPSWKRCAHLGMARCGVMLGDGNLNLESLSDINVRNRVKVLDGWTCKFLGGIFLNLGGSHFAESERWIQKAIEADSRNRMRFHLGLDHALYGELFRCQGNRTKAREQFGKSVDILGECGANGWVVKYEGLRDSL